jgi:hypothetical protein
MLRLASDEDFNGHVVLGLLRRLPELDIARVQDELAIGDSDDRVLQWATDSRRLLVSHDVTTLVPKAFQLAVAGSLPYGLIAVPQSVSIREAIDELEIVAVCGTLEDFQNRVIFLPLR